jgi:hypothetical protein
MRGRPDRAVRASIVALLLSAGCATVPPSASPSSTTPTPSASANATASPGPAGPVALERDAEWVVIAEPVPGGEAATIDVAVGDAAYVDLWLQRFPGKAAPSSPFNDTVYVSFNALVDAGCEEATMDALVFDAGAGLVYGEFTRVSGAGSCGDIAGADTFVVAIDRRALPSGVITFRLEREFEVCVDCGREREQVEVDL